MIRKVLTYWQIQSPTFRGGKFYELFEKCVESKDIILSVDSIEEVRLREGQNVHFIIADNADMDVSEITSTLNCKFVQFIIAQQLALISSSACKEPHPASCSTSTKKLLLY